jgi:hypothetical protein
MNKDRLLINLWLSQKKQGSNATVRLLMEVYDAKIRKQENECTKKNYFFACGPPPLLLLDC